MLNLPKEKIKDCTKNGKCSNCGECCTACLPISKEEYLLIKDYISTHHITQENPVDMAQNNIYFDCPFHDRVNKRCKIYEVRPEVCRNFLCSHSEKRIEKDRTFYDNKAWINGSHLHRVVDGHLLWYDYPVLMLLFANDLLESYPKEKQTEETLLHILESLASDIEDSEGIANPREIAEAIKNKDIKLTWKEE